MNTGTTDPAAAAAKFDFPAWLPPMLVKELRQGLRTRGFVLSMMALHVVMVMVFMWAALLDMFSKNSALEMVNGFFWTLTAVMLGLITPLRGLGGLRSEIDTRNIDLLLLTRLTSWRIVMGKWTSLMTQAALLVATMLPYGVVRYFFGSVDLLPDLVGLAWMFVLCGAATAVMLWLSGLPKLFRILLIIAFVLLLNIGFGPTLFMLLSRGYGMRSGFLLMRGDIPWVMHLLLIFDLLAATAVFLLQSVRRLAPPSENHSTMTRLLALLPVAPVVPVAVFSALHGTSRMLRDALEMQSVIALVGFMLVCVMELGSMQVPMPVQIRSLLCRDGWRALAGRLFLPGWQSAMWFTAAGLSLFCAMTLLGLFPDPMSRVSFLKALALVWAAVVFPAAAMSLLVRPGSPGFLIYLILQGAASTLCILVAAVMSSISMLPDVRGFIEGIVRLLPVSSFWFELAKIGSRFNADDVPFMICQGIMIVCVLAFAMRRARPYWRMIGGYVAEVKKNAASNANDPANNP